MAIARLSRSPSWVLSWQWARSGGNREYRMRRRGWPPACLHGCLPLHLLLPLMLEPSIWAPAGPSPGHPSHQVRLLRSPPRWPPCSSSLPSTLSCSCSRRRFPPDLLHDRPSWVPEFSFSHAVFAVHTLASPFMN